MSVPKKKRSKRLVNLRKKLSNIKSLKLNCLISIKSEASLNVKRSYSIEKHTFFLIEPLKKKIKEPEKVSKIKIIFNELKELLSNWWSPKKIEEEPVILKEEIDPRDIIYPSIRKIVKR